MRWGNVLVLDFGRRYRFVYLNGVKLSTVALEEEPCEEARLRNCDRSRSCEKPAPAPDGEATPAATAAAATTCWC